MFSWIGKIAKDGDLVSKVERAKKRQTAFPTPEAVHRNSPPAFYMKGRGAALADSRAFRALRALFSAVKVAQTVLQGTADYDCEGEFHTNCCQGNADIKQSLHGL